MNVPGKVFILGHGTTSSVLKEELCQYAQLEIEIVRVEISANSFEIYPQDLARVLKCQSEIAGTRIFVGLGYRRLNQMRYNFVERLEQQGVVISSYVSKSAHVARNAQIDSAALVLSGAIIEPFCNVGRGSIIWSGAHLSHHARVGDFAFLSSGATLSGYATLGDLCFLGTNATVLDRVEIGRKSLIGAGSVVSEDLESCSVVYPPQSRILREENEAALEAMLHD